MSLLKVSKLNHKRLLSARLKSTKLEVDSNGGRGAVGLGKGITVYELCMHLITILGKRGSSARTLLGYSQ